MSVKADMRKEYELQKLETVKSPTGARVQVWQREMDINVAVKPKSETRTVASVDYTLSTHTGITNAKDIKKAVNRLYDEKENVLYDIISVIEGRRMTEMLLKRVELHE